LRERRARLNDNEGETNCESKNHSALHFLMNGRHANYIC
jgi:hypothetical protein